MTEAIIESNTNANSDKWWVPIGVLVALTPVQIVFAVALPPDAYTSTLIAPFSLLGLALTLLSPVWVYLDKQYVSDVSEWEPSGWYFWMILPPLTLLLPVIYLYQRHKYVGVP